MVWPTVSNNYRYLQTQKSMKFGAQNKNCRYKTLQCKSPKNKKYLILACWHFHKHDKVWSFQGEVSIPCEVEYAMRSSGIIHLKFKNFMCIELWLPIFMNFLNLFYHFINWFDITCVIYCIQAMSSKIVLHFVTCIFVQIFRCYTENIIVLSLKSIKQWSVSPEQKGQGHNIFLLWNCGVL